MAREIRALSEQETIIQLLQGWGAAIKHIEKANPEAHAFLLMLDPTKMMLSVESFRQDELSKAQEQYLLVERNAGTDPRIQVVLVSVDSVDALRRAYPNYYVDTSGFIDAVRYEIG